MPVSLLGRPAGAAPDYAGPKHPSQLRPSAQQPVRSASAASPCQRRKCREADFALVASSPAAASGRAPPPGPRIGIEREPRAARATASPRSMRPSDQRLGRIFASVHRHVAISPASAGRRARNSTVKSSSSCAATGSSVTTQACVTSAAKRPAPAPCRRGRAAAATLAVSRSSPRSSNRSASSARSACARAISRVVSWGPIRSAEIGRENSAAG